MGCSPQGCKESDTTEQLSTQNLGGEIKTLKTARLQAKPSPSLSSSLPRNRRRFSKSWMFYSPYSVIGRAPELTFRDEGASELSCAGKGN